MVDVTRVVVDSDKIKNVCLCTRAHTHARAHAHTYIFKRN